MTDPRDEIEQVIEQKIAEWRAEANRVWWNEIRAFVLRTCADELERAISALLRRRLGDTDLRERLAGLHRYTITSEGASLGYFRLVEDAGGMWLQWPEFAAALAKGSGETEGWQPIASAPKDGRSLLLFGPSSGGGNSDSVPQGRTGDKSTPMKNTLNFHAIVGPNGMCMCGVKADGTAVTCAQLLKEQYEPKRYSVEDIDQIVNGITAVVREADEGFQKSGGTSRHWARDWFLPLLYQRGWRIEKAGSPDAVDPHAASTGKPTTREKESL